MRSFIVMLTFVVFLSVIYVAAGSAQAVRDIKQAEAVTRRDRKEESIEKNTVVAKEVSPDSGIEKAIRAEDVDLDVAVRSGTSCSGSDRNAFGCNPFFFPPPPPNPPQPPAQPPAQPRPLPPRRPRRRRPNRPRPNPNPLPRPNPGRGPGRGPGVCQCECNCGSGGGGGGPRPGRFVPGPARPPTRRPRRPRIRGGANPGPNPPRPNPPAPRPQPNFGGFTSSGSSGSSSS